MKSQTTLTGYSFTTSSHSSPAPSTLTSPGPLRALLVAMLSGSSVALSCMPLAMPFPALSHASSIVQSPVPLSVPSTCKSGQIGSGPDSDSDILESSHEPDDLEPGEGGAE